MSALVSLLVAMLAFLHAEPAFALDPSRRTTQYVQRQWTVEHGLPQDTVQAMTQTSDGFLWIGTRDGLARFDGAAFTTFDTQNTPELVSDSITALFQDRHDRLWIASSTGIAIYFRGRFERPPGLSGLRVVLSIAEDAEGAMWFASPREGVCRYADGRLSSFGRAAGVQATPAWSVLATASDFWIAMSTGLYRYRAGAIEKVPLGVFEGTPVYSLYVDGERRLWMASGRGLLRYDGAEIQRAGAVFGDEDSIVTGDRHGTIWVGNRRGVWRCRDGELTRISRADGSLYGIVNSLYIDDEDTLWVGTFMGGLSQIRDGTIVPYTKLEGMSDDTVWSIDGDGDGVWVGTERGVLHFLQGQWTSVRAMDGILVYTVTADGEGGVWAGTANRGLYHIKGDRITTFTRRDGLPSNSVTALLRDRSGRLWIGTAAGLARLQNGRILKWSEDRNYRDIITTLHEDTAGRVWVGSNGIHTRVFESDRWTDVFRGIALPRQSVVAIYEDHSGDFWFSTQQGIFRLHDNNMFLYTVQHGLPNGLVSHFFEDANGGMWMGCTVGIFCVKKSDLDAVMTKTANRFQILLYGIHDGLPVSEAASLFHPTAWQAPDGRVWMATARGIGVLDPGVGRPPLRHSAHIDKVVIDDVMLSAGASIVIGAGTNRLEIHYSVPTFVAPERVVFRYRLQGYDEGWIDAGNRRIAYYTKLPAGSYTFAVQAALPFGEWERSEEISIKLLPPFYRQPWFLVLCLAAALAILLMAHFARLRSVRLRHEAVLAERSRIARDFHDTMAQGLTGLSLQIEGAILSLNDPETAQANLRTAKTMARASLAETKRVLFDLRSDGAAGCDLRVTLQQMLDVMTSHLPIRGTLTVRGQARRLPDPDAEIQLLRIAQEAVTNALRHARAKNIDILLDFERDRLRLAIRDDGQGSGKFTLDELATSTYGLRGMRERAQNIGAKFTVRHPASRGIEIHVEVPA